MRTNVRVLRGALRGREGWIAGNIEDRRRRGITKAVVHAGDRIELLELMNLLACDQLDLFGGGTNKNAAGAMPTA